MWNSSEDLIGVTFDMATNTLYWTSWSTIYHAPTNQSEPEAYSTGECKLHFYFNFRLLSWTLDVEIQKALLLLQMGV